MTQQRSAALEADVLERMIEQAFKYNQPSPGSNAGCQSRGCEFESWRGQLSFRRLTKVNVTCVIRLPPMG